MDSTKLYDQWPTCFCCKEEDRQVWLDGIERSIHLVSSNKILNNDKEDENNGNDNNGWWNVGISWSSYGNNEDGDEDGELA